MQPPRREHASIDLPPILIYTTALTCGVMAALALQIHLSRTGFDLVDLWENMFSPQRLQLRAAGPWWAIAGAAFIVSGASAAALRRLPLPWRRFRLLRWATGAAIVFELADIGHSAAAPHRNLGASVAVGLAALGVAALMAMLGAYFTVRR